MKIHWCVLNELRCLLAIRIECGLRCRCRGLVVHWGSLSKLRSLCLWLTNSVGLKTGPLLLGRLVIDSGNRGTLWLVSQCLDGDSM